MNVIKYSHNMEEEKSFLYFMLLWEMSLYYVQMAEKNKHQKQAEKDEAFWNTEDISKSSRCSSTQNQTEQPDGHQLENKDKYKDLRSIKFRLIGFR